MTVVDFGLAVVWAGVLFGCFFRFFPLLLIFLCLGFGTIATGRCEPVPSTERTIEGRPSLGRPLVHPKDEPPIRRSLPPNETANASSRQTAGDRLFAASPLRIHPFKGRSRESRAIECNGMDDAIGSFWSCCFARQRMSSIGRDLRPSNRFNAVECPTSNHRLFLSLLPVGLVRLWSIFVHLNRSGVSKQMKGRSLNSISVLCSDTKSDRNKDGGPFSPNKSTRFISFD